MTDLPIGTVIFANVMVANQRLPTPIHIGVGTLARWQLAALASVFEALAGALARRWQTVH
jgi:hypothetical protein